MHFTLADLLTDLVQNAVAARSSRVEISWRDSAGTIVVRVTDNGRGMRPEQVEQSLSPFYTDGAKHPERTVGLGLPFLKQTAESVGGEFALRSRVGDGTTVGFSVPSDHIDLPPVGDLVSAFMLALAADTPEVIVSRSRGDRSYELRRSELVEALGDLVSVDQLGLLRTFIESQEDDVWQR